MLPSVAVIIPTLNRPPDLQRCVASVLACDYPDFEVIVVDQSVPPAAAPVPGDKRLRHLAVTTIGKCRALNHALRLTSADVLIFTDDDCTVTDRWISRHVELLTGPLAVDLVFASLQPGPHDPARELIPAFEPPALKRQSGRWAFLSRGGAGANLAVRRAVLEKAGGFDTYFGPGAKFLSCEEFDLYCRLLWAGRSAAFDPENPVLHFGARTYSDGAARRLLRGYAFGEGAVLGSHLRRGNTRAGVAIPLVAARYASYTLKAIYRRKPRGASLPLTFLWGAASAFVTYRPGQA